ncbi:EDD domain protein, DegV family [Dehalogenimonas alkenigignens]|uniref:EDD domain protein, DegV family n=1 Tax=Dehalogenimonas alkenigignens TaxID=1217799 RepID=A0A0W0GK96_9CHLR|nr:DegV family protein [Dehalogenimonas alkenigignens]KTB48946.1 EDD domain protein, DegV family [Dehalogenimonas alkenigignens]
MVIKVVTDSTSDIPAPLASELGITSVPLYVQFGSESFRDRADITENEFYTRLVTDPVHPTTAQPSPQDFAAAYDSIAGGADGILSIHISEKMSGTINSAQQGAKLMKHFVPVEVVDSKFTSMAQGLVVLAAARLARTAKDLKSAAAAARGFVDDIHLLVLFDTLKYIARGGRIGRAKALLGSILNVKPLLSIKDGEFVPVGQVRSRVKGIDRLFELARNASNNIAELAVIHSTTPDEAQMLANRIGEFLPADKIHIARFGPVLGVHGGPGVIAVAFRLKA